MTTHQPTPEQASIYDHVQSNSASVRIDARAGSGKTTVLEEISRRLPRNKKALFCAYNRRIAIELERRIGGTNRIVQTIHSLGFAAIRRRFNSVKIDKSRWVDDAKERRPQDWRDLIALVSRCKNEVALSEQAVADVCLELDVSESLINDARRMLGKAQRQTEIDVIDFDDMVFLPAVRDDLRLPNYAWLLIDEAQDLNPVFVRLLRKLKTETSQAAIVGDPFQRIYGFRGADAGAMDDLSDRFGATRLGLTICFRCARSIVEVARRWVSDLAPAPNAIDGAVIESGDDAYAGAKPGDFVLARLNAPLVRAALQSRVPAVVRGRDLGQELIRIIRQLRIESVPAAEPVLRAWVEKEAMRIDASATKRANRQRLKRAIGDKAAAISAFFAGAASTQQAIDAIDRTFADDGDDSARVVYSTVHKAKGLEADRVFVLASTFFISKDQRDGRVELPEEERNLRYVAVTRARKELIFCGQLPEDQR